MDNENKWEYDYSSQDKNESGDTGYPNVGSSGMNTANQYNDPQPEPETAYTAPQTDNGAGGATPPVHPVQPQDAQPPKKKKKFNGMHDRGAYFGSEKAREVLRDNGCWEDDDGCTHFPRTLVESALEAVPAEFVHHGRTPDDDIHMAQDQVYASNFGEGICIHDLETGERRPTVKQDAVDILRVVDALDNIHIYNRAIGPQDVPSESASMHNAEVAFCYTSKPMHLVSGSPFQTKKMIKMAEIAAGGKEELKRRPRTAFNHTTISPLRVSEEACENAMIVAEAGLPNHILVMVQQGATSPISYAGSVAVHNADFLAFNTLLQCVNRGNPTLYGASACVMDMKKGLSLVAAPEVFVLNAAMARMSKYYNIPSYIAGG